MCLNNASDGIYCFLTPYIMCIYIYIYACNLQVWPQFGLSLLRSPLHLIAHRELPTYGAGNQHANYENESSLAKRAHRTDPAHFATTIMQLSWHSIWPVVRGIYWVRLLPSLLLTFFSHRKRKFYLLLPPKHISCVCGCGSLSLVQVRESDLLKRENAWKKRRKFPCVGF